MVGYMPQFGYNVFATPPGQFYIVVNLVVSNKRKRSLYATLAVDIGDMHRPPILVMPWDAE